MRKEVVCRKCIDDVAAAQPDWKPMTDSEKKLLIALISMVEQYLWKSDDVVDSSAMVAGQDAIEALAHFGLIEVVDTRFGRWTDDGKRFRREEVGISDAEPVDHPGRIKLLGQSEPEN
jgi:hypothetical protein